MSTDDLIARHDQLAKNTGVGTAYYLSELERRESAAREEQMVRLTRRVFVFTVVVTLLTICNVVLVALK